INLPPRTAIQESWRPLENAMRNIADSYSIFRATAEEMIDALHERRIINTPVKEELHRLRKLRNLATHQGDDTQFPKEMAFAFCQAADRLIIVLRTPAPSAAPSNVHSGAKSDFDTDWTER